MSLKKSELKIIYVPGKILKDYAGMNPGAAREMHFHPKIKRNTILIDKALHGKDRIRTIHHEIIEYGLMKKGLDYWTAHQIALKKEPEPFLFPNKRSTKHIYRK